MEIPWNLLPIDRCDVVRHCATTGLSELALYSTLQSKTKKKRSKKSQTPCTRAIAYVFADLRQKAGLTQEEAADCADVSRGYISRLEIDGYDVRYSTLKRLSRCYKSTTSEVTMKIDQRIEFYDNQVQKKKQ